MPSRGASWLRLSASSGAVAGTGSGDWLPVLVQRAAARRAGLEFLQRR
jgi:hypothetical protein